MEFVQGWGDDVFFNEKKLQIEEAAMAPTSVDGKPAKGRLFDLKYDKLVVAVGCYSQTFGTPGVKENALFLKDVVDARKIRKRVLECRHLSLYFVPKLLIVLGFETASLPVTSSDLRDQLLNFAIVGGGRKYSRILKGRLAY